VFGVLSRFLLAKISLAVRLSEWGVLPSMSSEQEEDAEEMRSILREGIDLHRKMPGRLGDPKLRSRFDALGGRLEKVGSRVEARIARRKEQSEAA
jgi:hypothetical protein